MTVRLADVGTWRSGGTPPKDRDELWDGGFPWISTRDLKQPELHGSTHTITEDAASRYSTTVPAGSVLIGTRGMALAKRLPVAMVTQAVAFNQDIKAIEPHPGVSSKYLLYALLAFEGPILALTDEAAHGTKRLETDLLRGFRIPCPSIANQQRIADFLDAENARIDAVVDQRRRQAQLLVARRGSLVFAAISGTLGPQGGRRRPSAAPWLSTLPEGWSELKLTRVARLGSGHTPSRAHPEWWLDCKIPWITTGEVAQIRDDRREVLLETRENISEKGLANSAAELRPAGTVVLSRTASAGYSALMGTDMATSQDFVTWTCSDRLLPRFLLFCLRAMRSDLLGRLAMGSTHRTIYFPDIESIRIPLPPVAEQQRMLDLADRQLALLGPLEAAIDRQITLLRERRQALITAAVSGRVDVGG